MLPAQALMQCRQIREIPGLFRASTARPIPYRPLFSLGLRAVFATTVPLSMTHSWTGSEST
jgi:hypothetical protein